MKKSVLFGIALLLQTAAVAQLQNTSFEVWENPIDQPGGNRPVGWIRSNGNPASETMNFYHYPVTDAQHGDYALRLSIWYTYDKDMARQSAPIDYRPTALTGFYTYTENQILHAFSEGVIDDVAKAIVRLTKTDPATGEPILIGLGVVPLGAADTYQPFTCIVDYLSDDIPDRVEVTFDCSVMDKSDGGNGVEAPPGMGVCSILTVDNVSLTTQALATDGFTESELRLYPNPATDVVHLPEFAGEVRIFEMSGKQIGKYAVADGQIDVSFLAAGSYVLNFQNENLNFNKMLLKK